jgi:hypothetical protein
MGKTFFYNFDNVISYEKDFGNHHVLANGRDERQDGNILNMRSVREGYLTNTAPVLSNVMPDTMINSYTVQGDFGEGDSRSSYYFGRIKLRFRREIYGYHIFTTRRFLTFGKNNRYGYFLPFGGWVIRAKNS